MAALILFFVFVCGMVAGAASLLVISLAMMAGESSRAEEKADRRDRRDS